jgi:hypothetical protein
VRSSANDPYCSLDQKKQTKAWEPSVTDIREQWTEMYLRRMDFTGLIRLPSPSVTGRDNAILHDWLKCQWISFVGSHLAGSAASSHSVIFMWVEEGNQTSIS